MPVSKIPTGPTVKVQVQAQAQVQAEVLDRLVSATAKGATGQSHLLLGMSVSWTPAGGRLNPHITLKHV